MLLKKFKNIVVTYLTSAMLGAPWAIAVALVGCADQAHTGPTVHHESLFLCRDVLSNEVMVKVSKVLRYEEAAKKAGEEPGPTVKRELDNLVTTYGQQSVSCAVIWYFETSGEEQEL